MSYDRETEAGLKRLIEGLHSAFQPNREELKLALKRIINFHPEMTPAQFTSKAANPYNLLNNETREDAKAPFISESYLYNLLGKEDARTLLARVHQLCIVLGVDMDTLYEEEKA